jgi:4-hydroxyphenylpyruvate dioxygenase-like putative hemolysin
MQSISNIVMTLNNNSFTINPLSKIDHVHLRVSNLQESVNFYQLILGFKLLTKNQIIRIPLYLRLLMITIVMKRRQHLHHYLL